MEEDKERLTKKLEFFSESHEDDNLKIKLAALEQEIETKNTTLSKYEFEIKV